MKRILLLSALGLAMLGGVASADRGRGRWHRGDHASKGHSRHDRGVSWRGGASWSGGVRVSGPRVVQPRVVQPRVVVQSRPVYVQRVVRRPIYVQAPTIRYRYDDYYARPAVLVENYAPMTGYYWVAGSWSWNGYEWMWTAGHYEPDPNYGEPCDHDGYDTY